MHVLGLYEKPDKTPQQKVTSEIVTYRSPARSFQSSQPKAMNYRPNICMFSWGGERDRQRANRWKREPLGKMTVRQAARLTAQTSVKCEWHCREVQKVTVWQKGYHKDGEWDEKILEETGRRSETIEAGKVYCVLRKDVFTSTDG